MIQAISVWCVIGPSFMNAYTARREAEAADESYSGPMDDESYAILNTFADVDVVQAMYNTKSVNGNNPFTLFGMNFPDEQAAVDAIDYLLGAWPGKQLEVNGAWHEDTGEQMGTPPTYPIPDDAWTLMPDSVGATSNADLQDINLIAGQAPRIFV